MAEPPPAVGGLPRAGPEKADQHTGRGPAESAEFDEFFRSNFPDLVRRLRAICRGDQGLAEDVVQETMLIVFRHWHKIDQPRRYAFMVASRLALRTVRREMELRGVEGSLAYAEASAIGVPDSADIRYDLEQAIQSLPNRQRQVAVLRWSLGWSNTEIAAVLELSPSSVASHLHDARKRLQHALEIDPELAQGRDASAAEASRRPGVTG